MHCTVRTYPPPGLAAVHHPTSCRCRPTPATDLMTAPEAESSDDEEPSAPPAALSASESAAASALPAAAAVLAAADSGVPTGVVAVEGDGTSTGAVVGAALAQSLLEGPPTVIGMAVGDSQATAEQGTAQPTSSSSSSA